MPRVRFETNPPGAAVFLHERYIGVTPVVADVPIGEIEPVFWKGGYDITRYKSSVGANTQVVGTTLSDNSDVPEPELPATPATAPTTNQPQAGTTRKRWPIVLGVLALGGVGAGFWWYRRRGKRSSRPLRAAWTDRSGQVGGVDLGETATTSCSASPDANVAVRTCITRPKKRGPTVQSVDAVCKLLAPSKSADRESFFTISVDPGLRVIGVEETAKGGVGSVEVHPREVFKSAMLLGASAVILAHNHPSGDPTPSREDIELTKRIVKAGRLVGMPVLDHVVVGEDGCRSLSERMPSLFQDDETP